MSSIVLESGMVSPMHDAEAVVKKPVVHDALATIQEVHSAMGTNLIVADVNDTAGLGANVLLGEQTIHKLTLLNQEARILSRGRLGRVTARGVQADDLRDDHADNLLARPSRARLAGLRERGRCHPIPGTHIIMFMTCSLVEEDVSAAKFVDTRQGVLDNACREAVSLRGDNVQRDHAELTGSPHASPRFAGRASSSRHRRNQRCTEM